MKNSSSVPYILHTKSRSNSIGTGLGMENVYRIYPEIIEKEMLYIQKKPAEIIPAGLKKSP